MSKSAKNDNRIPPKNNNRPTAKRPHPWADVDGVDYGPAIAALGDLVAWAFELATADVADWPEGQRRVRTTRKYVLARLRGKPPRAIPFEDILFTAGLLARIFEAEIGLGMSEMVAVLDRIGLPTEVVPMMPRAQPHARMPLRNPVLPHEAPRDIPRDVLDLFAAALRQTEADGELDVAPCGECGHCPHFRNAA